MAKSITINVISPKIMSATEAAYTAGFVDGEGTISLNRAARLRARAGFRYQPDLSMANTCRMVLERIVEMCGNGRIEVTNTVHPIHKLGYRLRFTSNQIRHVLPQLYPYLIIKRKQAELLLEFLGFTVKYQHLSDDQYHRTETLRQELQALNRRGTTVEEKQAEWDAIRPSRLGNNQHLKTVQ
jgi:hypothetical protein